VKCHTFDPCKMTKGGKSPDSRSISIVVVVPASEHKLLQTQRKREREGEKGIMHKYKEIVI
jgi:hypothetical protein